MRAEVIGDTAALLALEPAWWDLFRRSPAATPFQSPAWLLPWWMTFAPGRLSSVAIWDGDHLNALAPFYIEAGPDRRRLLPLGIGVSDYLDILLDPASTQTADAFVEAILSTAADWDLWSIEEARPGAAILDLPIPPLLAGPVEPHSACPVLPLASTLRETIPSTRFRKWRMARNRLARREGIVEPTTLKNCADHVEHLFRLHSARWASRGEPGVLADDRVRAFHRRAAPALAAAGLLHGAIVRIAGEAAGVYYGLRGRSEEYAYLSGLDPAFTFESPGTILFCWSIVDSIESGMDSLHFLRGQEAYKYDWGARDRRNRRQIVMPPR